MEIWIILGAILVGQVARVILPYLSKKWDEIISGEKVIFDMKYLYNAITSTVWQFATALIFFMDYEPNYSFGNIGMILLAVIYGYGGNDLQEVMIKLVKRYKNKNTPMGFDV